MNDEYPETRTCPECGDEAVAKHNEGEWFVCRCGYEFKS